MVQYGRRKGSSRRVILAEGKSELSPSVDIRKVTVLPKSEWLRLQASVSGVSRHPDSRAEAARQRAALHLRSEQVVKKWPNTIAEHLANRDLIKATEAQNEKMEEESRRLFAKAKEKMMKLRKEKEAELFREFQRHREAITERLKAQHQEQTTNEEELIFKAVEEAEAKQAQQQREKDEKKAAMLKSIATHREAMAEKCAQDQRMKKEEEEFEASNAALIAEEENQFQRYAKQVIQTASEAQRNTRALRKAAREGIGGGLGPMFSGVRPSYLVHDESGVQMPSYVCSSSQGIKELNETVNIKESKKRLGFT
ncbi:hypothetical protein P4O66_014972, partial [Electrophorus voltai]